MLIEQRIYTMHMGAMAEYLAVYEADGKATQLRHLPRLVGCFTSEIGTLNQIIYLWGYEDLAERTRCRAALARDPLWPPYVQKIRPFIQSQENRILLPTAFSPIA
jgi:hypothetical protein